MKTTILIQDGRTQLCLHPESTHDKSVLDTLEALPNTHRTDLYARQGGYTVFSERWDSFNHKELGKDLLIVFDTPNPIEEKP